MNYEKSIGYIVLLALVVLGGPYLTITAINTIFATGIQFTFWNWVSMMWLHWIVASTK